MYRSPPRLYYIIGAVFFLLLPFLELTASFSSEAVSQESRQEFLSEQGTDCIISSSYGRVEMVRALRKSLDKIYFFLSLAAFCCTLAYFVVRRSRPIHRLLHLRISISVLGGHAPPFAV